MGLSTLLINFSTFLRCTWARSVVTVGFSLPSSNLLAVLRIGTSILCVVITSCTCKRLSYVLYTAYCVLYTCYTAYCVLCAGSCFRNMSLNSKSNLAKIVESRMISRLHNFPHYRMCHVTTSGNNSI